MNWTNLFQEILLSILVEAPGMSAFEFHQDRVRTTARPCMRRRPHYFSESDLHCTSEMGSSQYYETLTSTQGLFSEVQSRESAFLRGLCERLLVAQESATIDYILHQLNSLLSSGRFEEVDRVILDSTSLVPVMPSSVLVSFLGITWMAKDKLPSRKRFFQCVEDIVNENNGAHEASRMLGWFE